ncbi:MAG: single-stranded DNA-binding protein [Hyphomicrobiaceae bacterium]|nr:MAG: single-stranded DNA-binding protein [Hyphomicrobiaceae bacterium]
MASFNRVILMGNLTRDIQLRYTPANTPVCDVGLAVNEKVKRGEQWVDEACFVDLTMFGKTAEVASQYLSKGSPIFIEGRLKLETWEKEGTKHSKHKVIVDKMQMIGGKGNGGGGSAPAQSAPSQSQAEEPAANFSEDEIPF